MYLGLLRGNLSLKQLTLKLFFYMYNNFNTLVIISMAQYKQGAN